MHHQSSRAIVFDGDDTLWATQELYDDAKERFFALLAEIGHNRDSAAVEFARIDVANVARLGFSKERFPRSMRETYEFFQCLAGVSPDPEVAEKAAAIGRAVFTAVPTVRDDARAVLEELRSLYRLVLFTAGDLDVQRRRIEQTGLAEYFDHVCIAPQKSDDAWTYMNAELSPNSRAAWSVGNSVRSDINPALRLGLRSVVVAGKSWEYERSTLAAPPVGAYALNARTLGEAFEMICQADSCYSATSAPRARS